MYYFFGFPDEIVCFGGTNGNLNIDVEDTATIIFNYKKNNGRLNTVTILIDFIKRPKQMDWTITADNGSIYADFTTNTLCLNDYNNNKINQVSSLKNFPRNDLFINEQKEFFNLINANSKNNKLPDLSESKKIIGLLIKIVESMESKKIISF